VFGDGEGAGEGAGEGQPLEDGATDTHCGE
jgi:hypothetical protein